MRDYFSEIIDLIEKQGVSTDVTLGNFHPSASASLDSAHVLATQLISTTWSKPTLYVSNDPVPT